jgi:hypothetical protein
VAIQKHNFFHYLFMVVYCLVETLIRSLGWFLLAIAGYLVFQTKRAPVDLIVGLPLMLVGGGLLVNSLWTGLMAVFSPDYNKEICILCEPERFKDHARLKKLFGSKFK